MFPLHIQSIPMRAFDGKGGQSCLAPSWLQVVVEGYWGQVKHAVCLHDVVPQLQGVIDVLLGGILHEVCIAQYWYLFRAPLS